MPPWKILKALRGGDCRSLQINYFGASLL